ncbi:unnamed protein product [Ilex paraguariensis]|uniref:Uncharacterized protein n=1 Tax=Ilex paraguariensis TaxID=185542 RepID=A0ABC8SWV6_9AQUA
MQAKNHLKNHRSSLSLTPSVHEGFLVQGCGEHAEIAACGAFMAKEGVFGVEFKTPFSLDFGLAPGFRFGSDV